MAKILIVYYSKTGNTKEMAESIGIGASRDGGVVTIKSIEKVIDS